MAQRILRWSAKKNNVYDLGAMFASRSEEARGEVPDRHERSILEFLQSLRMPFITLTQHIQTYRDLYIPKRVKKTPR